jgi:hypothetical protein
MPSRRNIFLCGIFFFLALASSLPAAAEQSAQDFLAAIYKTYEGRDSRGVAVDSPKFKTVVTPGLWALVRADLKRAARSRIPPELSGDPFVDAQDWDISALKIDVQEDGAKATARVSFKNGPRDQTVTLNLVKAKSGWLVDDCVGAEGSVRKMLAKK